MFASAASHSAVDCIDCDQPDPTYLAYPNVYSIDSSYKYKLSPLGDPAVSPLDILGLPAGYPWLSSGYPWLSSGRRSCRSRARGAPEILGYPCMVT